MKNTRFSKTTQNFYPPNKEYRFLPEDVIEVPIEDFNAALARGAYDTLSVVDGRVVVVLGAAPTAIQLAWSAYQQNAAAAIANSNDALMLFIESGVAVPAEWVAYRKVLRGIVNASSGKVGKLPTLPASPAGT